MSLSGKAWSAAEAISHVRLAWSVWVDSMANVKVAVALREKQRDRPI